LNEWVGVISLLEYSQDHLDEFEERLEWEDDDEALDDLNDRMELMRADVERAQVVFFKVNAFPASLNSFKARLAFGSLPEKWVAWGNQVLSLLDSNEHMENYTWQGFYDSFLDVEPGVAGEDDGYDDDGYVEGVTPNLCFFVATGLDSLDEYHLDHINNEYSSFGSNFPYLQKAFTTPNALIEMLKTMEQTHSFWYNMVAVFSFADEEFELMKGEKCND
ncbi:MAG: hypothetical protein KKB70_00405, partial [Proteobacteria bacterium]|nr:hypothetical protein [Pseudomonadota bacterium]